MNSSSPDTTGKLVYFGRDLEAMSFARKYHSWIIDEFRPYFGSTVGEIGAGTGNFSRMLVEAGIPNLTSFEPAENMFSILRERVQATPQIQAVNGYFGDECDAYEGAFDSLVYVNVLEHIERDGDELIHIRNSLRPGGHALIFVPALQWLYSDLDEKLGHFRRYHKPELLRLFSRAGFKVLKLRYFDLLGVLPWYFAYTLLKRPMTGGSVSLYDNLVVPITRALERLAPAPFGKNLLLVATKP
jgi:SAM-dependent methyltransferase